MTHCPKCGARLSPGFLGDACPNCALQAAFEFRGPNAHVPEPITQIGPYRLLEKIGEGGLGVVYMAEQQEPIRRRVAVKLIKPGMDSREVIARFEAERQAMALMAHPNIATIFDAGATETGHPYFAMELVRGIRITEYCDRHNLSTRERLDLFIIVAQAVQHAHQKGIIHRDLKPSNILVTVNDGVPVPKIIDFGIAKATQQPLTEKTLFTRFNQLLGTPAYMSPEQAELTSLDIDTRTDIYSLGVLLYELLTGHTPFDAKELFKASLEHMLRTIRETEPSRPSARLSTLTADDLTTVARQRRTDPPKLIHAVRGDLDWIVMKCLDKDRARRYETANGLASDIRRHLNQKPVAARPPNTFYQTAKFVRRNRVWAGASAAVASILLLATIISVGQWRRTEQARKAEAEQRQHAQVKALAEAEARAEATEQRDKALRILYASDLFLADRALRETNLSYAPEILKGLQEAIERQPAHPALWHARGVMLERNGQMLPALSNLSMAVELASTNRMHAALAKRALIDRYTLLRTMNRGSEAAVEYRRLKGLPDAETVGVLSNAIPDFSTAMEVTVEFGKTNRSSGLQLLDVPDSKHTPAIIDGQECRLFPGNNVRSWNYAYLCIDPTYKWTGTGEAVVRVEYQGVGLGELGIEYDSHRSSYGRSERHLRLRKTNSWQLAEFRLTDARLDASQNGGADIRIWMWSSGVYLRRVSLSLDRTPQHPRAAAIPKRNSAAKPRHIDLSAFYDGPLTESLHDEPRSGKDLSEMPSGLLEHVLKIGMALNL